MLDRGVQIETAIGIDGQFLAALQHAACGVFCSMDGPKSSRCMAPLSSNDGDVVQGWALDDQGIVISSEWDVAKYLESGRLRRILPEFALPSADLYAYYPSKQNLPARVRAFINFLVDNFATEK